MVGIRSSKSRVKKSRKEGRVKFLKDKAWRLFSKYIRLKYADKSGKVRCVTCGKVDDWKNMQAAHLVQGRGNAILFDERGVYPCCYRCNVLLGGNLLAYMQFLERKLGVKKALRLRDELLRKSKQPKKITQGEYLTLIEELEEKISKLEGRGET